MTLLGNRALADNVILTGIDASLLTDYRLRDGATYQDVVNMADAADALQERLDAITAQAQAANERRIAAIPDAMKSLVPEYDDPLKVAAWLDANAAVFSRPAPPPLDGRAGGNGTPATVTDEEVRAYAARMRLDPEYVDRAKLAKLKR